jgi:ADP-ribose pyrophosphatase YjhB (NUDIX family)
LLSSQYDEEYFDMKREYPSRPIVGVSAVVFDNDRVLLARRGKSPGKDTWNLPGGAVEIGERLEEAIRREIREEASLDFSIGGLVGVFDTVTRDEKNKVKYHYILVNYWGGVLSGKPKADSDVKELRWVSLDKIEMFGIAENVKKSILMASDIRIASQDMKDSY